MSEPREFHLLAYKESYDGSMIYRVFVKDWLPCDVDFKAIEKSAYDSLKQQLKAKDEIIAELKESLEFYKNGRQIWSESDSVRV